MLGGLVRVILSLSSFSKFIDFVTLTKLGLLSFPQLLVGHVELALLTSVACLTRLELICHLFQLSLLSVMIATSLAELLEQLHLVFLFDAVELAELVELSDKRVNHLHAFKQLLTALLVTLVLLRLNCVMLVVQVGDLVSQCVDVALFGPQFHHFLPELV